LVEVERVVMEGRPAVAVFSVDGEIFVLDDPCTHRAASLADEGVVEGYILECTRHRGRFDLRTGAVVGPPCVRAARIYTPIVEDSIVYVRKDELFARR
jgi:3-phenylpropionate/trans-cinnamate dioxygenase ferredoxin component